MVQFQTTHVRASTSTGKTGKQKRDGYAAGSVPSAMIGTKTGQPYSGPNMARVKRGA